MTPINEVKMYCRDLSPNDAERAVKFNEISKDEAIITYKMFLEQKKLPRKIFIEGYNAMYAVSALFLAKKYKVKLDEVLGGTHKNMRVVLDFYTRDSEHNQKLISLYEEAIERFISLSKKYRNEEHFAERVVNDLINEGFYQGKKVTYYSDSVPGRKDPLELTMDDAQKFLDKVVEPFLFIMEKLSTEGEAIK